jgi:hypothetical protein
MAKAPEKEIPGTMWLAHLALLALTAGSVTAWGIASMVGANHPSSDMAGVAGLLAGGAAITLAVVYAAITSIAQAMRGTDLPSVLSIHLKWSIICAVVGGAFVAYLSR